MTEAIRVLQLSDTHFLEADAAPEGGFAYNTAEAFDAVRLHAQPHLSGGGAVELVTVTGDVADHGRPAQYQQGAVAFESLGVPVNVCPGNHDLDAAFTLGMGRTRVNTSRAVELGNWCFLFADSNRTVMVTDEAGRLVDPVDPEDRLHSNGGLGPRESDWIREMCATTTAEHVFIWIHHPPAAPVGLTADAAYDAEWQSLLTDLAIIRGIGGGHTHAPMDYKVDGRPVYVCPSLKNNFDLAAQTLLPPGYRTYSFSPDGTITSELQFADDERWPRHPMPRSVLALLNGDITYAQFDEIVARRS